MSDWWARAACRDQNPELFFPVGAANGSEAKAVCRHCRVARQCLEWALAHGYDTGIWGGLSAAERRALPRRQARP